MLSELERTRQKAPLRACLEGGWALSVCGMLNIMLLQAEDTGRHMGCYGDGYARTPHLDRLASEGVRYTQAFTHAPVCAPSRGGMVVGCYPWSTGQHLMRTTLCNPAPTFTELLVQAGYAVHWPTKLDFNMTPRDGWCHSTEPWWDRPAPQQPFFVYENINLTHESRMFPELPSYMEADDHCPAALRHDPAMAEVPPYILDCAESRWQLARYYDALSGLDARVGERLQWLDAHGLRDNTLVIFLSDHGRGLPREKRWCYEAGLHMPLILRWPDTLQAGTLCDDLVGWVDIAPTVLSLAGVPVPAHYHGQVFLGPQAAPPRQYVYAGRDRMDDVYDQQRVVRDRKWHYIRNTAPHLPYAQKQQFMESQPVVPVMRKAHAEGRLSGPAATFFAPCKPDEELYDIEADPHCLHNLSAAPECAAVLERMRAALAAFQRAVPDLGQRDERELIAEGIVHETYNAENRRPMDLPPSQQLGPLPIPLTLNDAIAAKDAPRRVSEA